MTYLDDKLVIAVSSRALFDFDEADRVFREGGVEAYRSHQLDRLQTPALPGVAFGLVQKLLRFNSPQRRRVEVVVLSRNDPTSGLRVFHSAKEHGLDISRGAFTGGAMPFRYLKPFQAVLFLSAKAEDVEGALAAQCPAATVYTQTPALEQGYANELRIAFDGDGVLFDDASEQVYRRSHLAGFVQHEVDHVATPLAPGPFQPFFRALHTLRHEDSPLSIRTALITARSAPAHERAVLTLLAWGIEVDEAIFLGGVPKKDFLAAFNPDFFFDDQKAHTNLAAEVTATGHVPYGVANQS